MFVRGIVSGEFLDTIIRYEILFESETAQRQMPPMEKREARSGIKFAAGAWDGIFYLSQSFGA